jgi:Fic family protein
MEKKKSYEEIKIEENQNKYNFEDIFKNRINFQILILLFIYSELNIPNIAKILGICKSTAIRHLTEMENYKLIELSKEQKVRSDLKRDFINYRQAELRIYLHILRTN